MAFLCRGNVAITIPLTAILFQPFQQVKMAAPCRGREATTVPGSSVFSGPRHRLNAPAFCRTLADIVVACTSGFSQPLQYRQLACFGRTVKDSLLLIYYKARRRWLDPLEDGKVTCSGNMGTKLCKWSPAFPALEHIPPEPANKPCYWYTNAVVQKLEDGVQQFIRKNVDMRN